MKENNNAQQYYCGWDIGGAHLKVAVSNGDGKLLHIKQYCCPLWKGIEELEKVVSFALSELPHENNIHAITMTGELVDAFNHRQQGVELIVDCLEKKMPHHTLHVFAKNPMWLSATDAKVHWQDVASMNWLASATWLSQQLPQGLFIDIGSTTCDIIPIDNNQVSMAGYSDYERQKSGELVYTGAIRTPLISLASHAPLHGELTSLAAEWFATSADIWCLLGELDGQSIQDDSADGQPWQPPYCEQRLARMLGCDKTDATTHQWRQLASWFAEQQIQRIVNACYQVLSRQIYWQQDSPIIAGGVGYFIVERVAQRLNKPAISIEHFYKTHPQASLHMPASALALLAHQQLA